MQESFLKQCSSQTDGAAACPLFLCDLPLHNAVLPCLSLLCDSWQSQSWLRFSEVTSDILHHLANSAWECSEVLWLHLRRSVCRVLCLMFSFVYRVLSLVFFVFAIHTSSIFHTPPVEEYRPTVWMDFVPLPHSIHITIIRQLLCNMLEKNQPRKSNLMWFLYLCFIIYLPLTSSSELWSYLNHCFAVILEQCCTEWKLSQGTLKEGLYITYISVYFSYKYEL